MYVSGEKPLYIFFLKIKMAHIGEMQYFITLFVSLKGKVLTPLSLEIFFENFMLQAIVILTSQLWTRKFPMLIVLKKILNKCKGWHVVVARERVFILETIHIPVYIPSKTNSFPTETS